MRYKYLPLIFEFRNIFSDFFLNNDNKYINRFFDLVYLIENFELADTNTFQSELQILDEVIEYFETSNSKIYHDNFNKLIDVREKIKIYFEYLDIKKELNKIELQEIKTKKKGKI